MTIDDKNQLFLAEQIIAYHEIVDHIGTKLTQMQSQATLVEDFNTLSLANAQQAADQETWSLFFNAFKHLRSGGPGAQMGLFSTAVQKISLRSSSLAAGLGVAPPEYEMLPHSINAESGRDLAYAYSLSLMDVAEADLKKSTEIIYPAVLRPQISTIFGMAAKETPAIEHKVALKRQLMMSFENLRDAYQKACRGFRVELAELRHNPAPRHPHGPAPIGL